MPTPIDAAIVDLDGTVYRGSDRLPGAREGIAALRAAGASVCFFSNNPTMTPAQYVDRLAGHGIEATEAEVLTAGSVTAAYLRANHPNDQLFVVGEAGLRAQLAGLSIVEDPEAAAVVLGSMDRSFTYDRLAAATRALRTAMAFYGTDPDRTIPGPGDEVLPGSGAILAAMSTASERDPIVLGKPSEWAAERALERLSVPADRCLVVGDRLDTDVAMAGRAGMRSALVLTGTHGEGDIDRYAETPDYVFEDLRGVKNVLDG